MKFQQYINEISKDEFLHDEEFQRKYHVSFQDIVNTLNKDCRPFLREILGNGFIYRGSKNIYHPTEKIKARKDRKPVDTKPQIHEYLNKRFKQKFGWKVRNGIFAQGKYSHVRYGYSYLFFPIGKYEYVWSPKVKDLFTEDIFRPSMRMGATYAEFFELYDEKLTKIINSYKSTDLRSAILSEHEISFKCDYYYMVFSNYHLEQYLSNAFSVP